MHKKIRVAIIDDHTLFRTGLSELLSRRGLEVVAMTGQPSKAVSLVAKSRPDIVLLDLRMPKVSGLTVLKQLREQDSEQTIIVLTTSVEDDDLFESLRLGANGYLLKDMDPDNLVHSISNAKSGEMVIAPDFTSVLARAAVRQDTGSGSQPTAVYNLTPRELEILCHIAQGQSNKEIARDLGITYGTVKLHVRAVMKKLDVQSRVQAAVLAVSEGICENSDNNDQ